MNVYCEPFLGVSIMLQAFSTKYTLTGFLLILEDVNISSLPSNPERSIVCLYFFHEKNSHFMRNFCSQLVF